MREIKFRAFNTYAKAMYPVDHFALRCDGVWMQLMNVLENGDEAYVPSQGAMVFMQYTGLKDKNGREIYEGDIVKIDGRVGAVEYDRYAFCVNGFYKTSYDTPSDAFSEGLDKCEVIGNIMENPELLEK